VAEVVQEGETHLLRIVSIDPDRQRIGLSLKAVTATEQIEWMAQRPETVAEGDGVQEDESEQSAASDKAIAEEPDVADDAAPEATPDFEPAAEVAAEVSAETTTSDDDQAEETAGDAAA
jgi:hypothetical protein